MNDVLKNSFEPVVSVIVPVHNGERYIEESIRSVLSQTYENLELIVIDDGSEDSTAEIVEKLSLNDSRLRFEKNPEKSGVAKTRNRGIELSRGEFVAFLDADDIWSPEKLEKQLQIVEKEGADLVYTSYEIVNSEGQASRDPYLVPETVDFKGILKENVIGCSTVLLRSDIAKKYKFVENFYHEDYCLWLDILRDGYKAVGCRETLVKWRFITNSRSFNKKNSAIYRWKIYREYLSFSFVKSARLFVFYMIGGIKKYYS
ncbi:MAG: glycosyltransferase [Clostridia bacterium]|nr:glycosyltransferase [Clostridia bacterium]